MEKEYIYESVVREVKFEKVSDSEYNVYTSESVFGYDWEIFATLQVVKSNISDYGMLDDIQDGIIRNFFYNEVSFLDETQKGFYLVYTWKNYSDSFSVEKVSLDESPYYFLNEDNKLNSLVLKIERVDEND